MVSIRPRKSRLVIIPAAGLVAFALVTTDMIFMIKDTQTTDLALESFKGSARGAAVLNAFAVTSIVILTFTRSFNTQPRLMCQTIPGWIGALLGLASTIITINVLILKKINPSLVHHANSEMGLSTEIELAVWALATAAQFVFYVVCAFVASSRSRSKRGDDESPSSSPLATLEKKRSPPPRPDAPQLPPHMLATPFPSAKLLSDTAPQLEPPQFLNSHIKRSSWRDSLASLQQIVRPQPAPQQRRLLQQSVSSTARSSLSSDSKVALSQHFRTETSDSFNWDFSAPATQARDTTQAPARKGGLLPINGTMLPTIPGSRPTSQGQALGEPFEMDKSSANTYVSDKSKDSFDVQRPASSASSDKFSLERVRDLSERPISVISSTSTCTLPDNFPVRPDTSTSMHDLPRPPTSSSVGPSYQSRPTTAYSTHSSARRPAIISRPTTPSMHESHIHPLFRADSPVPPPAVSAGTIITASTFSGQTIGQVAPRPYVPFAPDTPPPAIPARSPSRQRAVATPPPGKRTEERFDTPKSGTPISRSTTPTRQLDSTQSSPQGTPKHKTPIPNFILSASNERLL